MANLFSNIAGWVNDRAPNMMPMYRKHMTEYYAPKNFNLWYYFGSLAIVVLVNQILTGIFLTMFYKPGAATAFDSVEYIMRDVEWGWLIRYMHSTGASMFFVVVFLHMFRGLMYGSYKKPRELVWLLGMLIFLALMAEAFMGYVLPWGNMSFWGAKVIISLFGAIPWIGDTLVQWIMGDYNPADATLNRFFALHVIAFPLVLLGLVVAHILALHDVGSNNPDGVEIKKVKGPDGHPLDGIPFHPYYTVKDIMGAVLFLAIFCFILFFVPEVGGYFLEYNNFIPADPLKTPQHIAPVWYFTPYYSILRAVPPLFHSQFPGVLAMGVATMILFFLPWLDRSPVKSIRYRGTLYKSALAMFVVIFLVLGYLGTESTTVWGQFGFDAFFLDTKDVATWVARVCTVLYFAFFFLMPWYTARDKVLPVPERVTS
jgi:ubiquinol-cytochrome c reductase cytochrome b subunit